MYMIHISYNISHDHHWSSCISTSHLRFSSPSGLATHGFLPPLRPLVVAVRQPVGAVGRGHGEAAHRGVAAQGPARNKVKRWGTEKNPKIKTIIYVYIQTYIYIYICNISYIIVLYSNNSTFVPFHSDCICMYIMFCILNTWKKELNEQMKATWTNNTMPTNQITWTCKITNLETVWPEASI